MQRFLMASGLIMLPVAALALANVLALGAAYHLGWIELKAPVYAPQNITVQSSASDWVEVTYQPDGGSFYVNLAEADKIVRGTYDKKPATLIWDGGTATPVNEKPEALMAAPRLRVPE